MADNGIFVYVSNTERSDVKSGEILVLQLDPDNGDLMPVQQLPINGKVMPMAVSPDRRFLYAALRSRPYSVASFAIDALNGRLTHLADAPLPESMCYISTDRTGRFLFGASIPEDWANPPISSLISVSPIGPHGFVQPPHQIVRTEPKAHAILPDPANRHVIVTCCDGGVVLRQIFDAATGMFSPNPLPPVRVKPTAGPRHFVFHPNCRFLYLLNEPDASIYTFEYDANSGALKELQIVSAVAPDFKYEKPHAADLHITPDGRFLYASERISTTLAAFKVDLASGMLTPAGHFPTEKVPRGFNIDPYGRYLLAVGRLSHSMTSYAIDRDTGSLTRLKQYPMGRGPNWVEIIRLP